MFGISGLWKSSNAYGDSLDPEHRHVRMHFRQLIRSVSVPHTPVNLTRLAILITRSRPEGSLLGLSIRVTYTYSSLDNDTDRDSGMTNDKGEFHEGRFLKPDTRKKDTVIYQEKHVGAINVWQGRHQVIKIVALRVDLSPPMAVS
ncbi:hypothetical protein CHS0354_029440 [Potamilus streckersoni]|uniref:Uncharacterized protein n=1 Tax=Potamilus streckersoni TaxID=2493646 RepID=A0AAE0STG4_9BIVA|nr:hypothetical protein CHS0354_029440 [Potamilus streckersoni]